jgi:predicted DNA-binding transcriptional regulator YafY
MELLRTAVREDREVALGVAEPDGRIAMHTVQPISLAAGAVRGWEHGKTGLVSYPVHRITEIRLLDGDGFDDPA